MLKGKFIAIYGINNVGKTTQAKLIVKRMNEAGYKAEYVKYPVYHLNPTGEYLNKILRGGKKQRISEEELQTWFVLNRFQFEEKLKKKLEKGINIIAEDYIGTGIAWGTAKGADMKWLENLNKYLLKEDLAFLLTGKRYLHAKEKKHLHETNEKLIKKSETVLKKLSPKYGWKEVEIIDGDIEATNDLLLKKIINF